MMLKNIDVEVLVAKENASGFQKMLIGVINRNRGFFTSEDFKGFFAFAGVTEETVKGYVSFNIQPLEDVVYVYGLKEGEDEFKLMHKLTVNLSKHIFNFSKIETKSADITINSQFLDKIEEKAGYNELRDYSIDELIEELSKINIFRIYDGNSVSDDDHRRSILGRYPNKVLVDYTNMHSSIIISFKKDCTILGIIMIDKSFSCICDFGCITNEVAMKHFSESILNGELEFQF